MDADTAYGAPGVQRMQTNMGKTRSRLLITSTRGKGTMTHSEWWTRKAHNGRILFMHVTGEGAEYHQNFDIAKRESCPNCDAKVPDALILGAKIGAL